MEKQYQTRQTHIHSYCTDGNTTPHTNNPLFKYIHKITDTTYEITQHKKTINHDHPIQIAFFVYNLTKLQMLQFYYDILIKYFDVNKFELSQMDTDSLYFAICDESIDEILKSIM